MGEMNRLRAPVQPLLLGLIEGHMGKKMEGEGLRAKKRFSFATCVGSETTVSEETVRQRNHDKA